MQNEEVSLQEEVYLDGEFDVAAFANQIGVSLTREPCNDLRDHE